MAKVWKKLQRSDADYTGNVTGTVDGETASNIKTKAIAGAAAKVITDDAFDASNKLKATNAVDALVNSNVTKTDVGLDQVANESPTTLKSTMSLNNVENKSQATILAGNLTGSVDGTAVATVKSGAASGATIAPAFDTSGTDPIIKVANAPATLKNASISIASDGSLSGGGGGQVTASALGAVKTDLSNAPDTIKNSEVDAAHVGLGNVPNKTEAQLLAGNLTGTIAGTAVATVKSGAASGATANQDSTATILGGTLTGNVSGTIGGTAVATIKSGAAAGATANQDSTSAIRAGTTAANVGLDKVVNQKVAIVSGKIELDDTAQTIDADSIDGDSKATIKAAAVSTAETNIIGSAPGALNTLAELASSLGNDASFSSTVTTSLASKATAPVTIADPTVTPTVAVGVQGIYSDELYVCQDV